MYLTSHQKSKLSTLVSPNPGPLSKSGRPSAKPSNRLLLAFCGLASGLVSLAVLLTLLFADFPSSQQGELPSRETVFWRDEDETWVPPGFSPQQDSQWAAALEKLTAVDVVNGPCGRMQNRQIIFHDGSRSCARYRINDDQLQGEVFTHHLARLLGIRNTPPTHLLRVNFSAPTWSRVHSQLEAAGWQDGRPVVLTRWIGNTSPAEIPNPLRAGPNQQTTSRTAVQPALHPRLVGQQSGSELRTLIQWSDLLLLDYLTGNLDRYVNSLVNAAWNDRIMQEPAHNLERETGTGLLLFLDNESGLFHGYRLLDRYQHHHRYSLDRLCIFRRSTVHSLTRLPKEPGKLALLLNSVVEKSDRDIRSLPPLLTSTAQILSNRISDVISQIDKCTKIYNRS